MPISTQTRAVGTASAGGAVQDRLGDPLQQQQAAGPRRVKGGGGYVYDQFPDGAIVIVDGPSGKGARLTSGRAWDAITSEIGKVPAVQPGGSPGTGGKSNGQGKPGGSPAPKPAASGQSSSFGGLLDLWNAGQKKVGELASAGQSMFNDAVSWGQQKVAEFTAPATPTNNKAPATATKGVTTAGAKLQPSGTQTSNQPRVNNKGQDVPEGGGTDVKAMSQFVWYGAGVRELSFTEADNVMKTISETFGVGSYKGSVTTPSAEVTKKNPNDGYWWFTADDKPTWSGGAKYIENTTDWSLKLNDVSAWLSSNPPGKRPGYMKNTGKNILFSTTKKDGFDAVPEKVQNLDAMNIPGGASCFATSEAMMNQGGVHAVGPGHAEEMLTIENEEYEKGKVTGLTTKPDAMAKAKEYIDWSTSNGKPVFVGVTYTNRNGNSDKITDHWVVIDKKVGDGRFSFHDPGRGSTSAAASDKNVFEWDGTKLQNTGDKKYVVSWVRPNAETLGAWKTHWAEKQAQVQQ